MFDKLFSSTFYFEKIRLVIWSQKMNSGKNCACSAKLCSFMSFFSMLESYFHLFYIILKFCGSSFGITYVSYIQKYFCMKVRCRVILDFFTFLFILKHRKIGYSYFNNSVYVYFESRVENGAVNFQKIGQILKKCQFVEIDCFKIAIFLKVGHFQK